MDGTGVPVVKKETEGRKGKTDGQPAHTRESSWDASSHRPHGTQKATPSAIRIRLPIPEPARPPKTLANASIGKPGTVAGAARQRKSSSATGPNGSGTWPISTSPAPCRSSISITLASTSGTWRTRKPG